VNVRDLAQTPVEILVMKCRLQACCDVMHFPPLQRCPILNAIHYMLTPYIAATVRRLSLLDVPRGTHFPGSYTRAVTSSIYASVHPIGSRRSRVEHSRAESGRGTGGRVGILEPHNNNGAPLGVRGVSSLAARLRIFDVKATKFSP
jgi:hypothetical protein